LIDKFEVGATAMGVAGLFCKGLEEALTDCEGGDGATLECQMMTAHWRARAMMTTWEPWKCLMMTADWRVRQMMTAFWSNGGVE
jgi:hypothetical protein